MVALAAPIVPGATASPGLGRAAASTPAVQVMVVGSGGAVLARPRTISAGSVSVAAGSRSCAVAAGTPLAGLAAIADAGGPAFSVRDYGHCNASAVNSGQLFVYRVGGESNRGQDGWEYKVDGISGTAGAADESGPLGNGRLMRSGDRLLWFWCQARAGGCQRTLELGAPARVSRGERFAVYVRGYDNYGHSVPVGGVRVHLGSRSAMSAPGGKALLTAPSRAGSFTVAAARSGLVPAFPRTIAVR
jgi:hypothetical protein